MDNEKLKSTFQMLPDPSWMYQSLLSSATILLLAMLFKSAPGSTSTSFIGSKWKMALSDSDPVALALLMDSKSQTRIHPSQPVKY